MAPAPAPTPAMDVEDEGSSGTKNQNSMVGVKSEAVCSDSGPMAVSPKLVKDEGGDTTECSSSFGNTCSGFEDEADSGEPEVNSGMSAHANDGEPSKPPRRKKVTDEWKNSIRPILWRCQWLELRMKELSSQVSKYDRELAIIKKQKEMQHAVSKANGSMPESMQIHKGHGNSIMKRRKRNRHEENVDTSLYINKHQILSYYHGKQNKAAETDDLLIDDDCGNKVDGSIKGGLDAVTLLDSEDCDMIVEQLTLHEILSTIDGAQCQVHLLQDRLRKGRPEGENLAFSEDNTYARVPRKRQHTQKRSFSYTNHRHTKPQKKKNLNILLKDDDGPALTWRSNLPDREIDAHIKDTDRNSDERSEDCNDSREKTITVGLLLGAHNFKSNGHIGDLCKENIDDILIDNQAANEVCQEFDKAKHLSSGTSSKGQNISAPAELNISSPAEVGNTCALVKVDTTCAPVKSDTTCASVKVDSTSSPVVDQESFLEKSPSKKPASPGKKQELKPKKRKRGSFFTKKQRKVTSKIPDEKEKTEGTPSVAKNETESTPSASAKEKTEGAHSAAKNKNGSTPSDAAKERTGSTHSAAKGPGGRKRKSVNGAADAKHESGTSSLASKEQTTGKPSSAAKQETENSSATAKHQETESTPSKLRVEKAVLVEVNSRRSQRVRKPKVFAE